MKSQITRKLFMSFCLFLFLAGNFVTNTIAEVEDDDSQTLKSVPVTEEPEEILQEDVSEEPIKLEGATPEQQYDEEEFVGFDKIKKEQIDKEKVIRDLKLQQELKQQNIPYIPKPRENYYIEFGFSFFIVAYLINFWIGKRKNEAIARAWFKAASTDLSAQFSRFIIGNVTTGDIIKDTNNTFRLKLTGRVNCIGLQVNLKLRKRHDLISVLTELIMPSEDELKITILMNDEAMSPFVFAIIKKKNDKKFRKENKDMALTTSYSLDQISDQYSCLSETEELIDALLVRQVNEALKNYSKEFISLHFSDQAVVSTQYKKTLIFNFILPKDPEKLSTLTKMAIYFIDSVARLSLSKPAQQKIDKHRVQINESKLKETHLERQEAAQQRKLEKIQKEKSIIETLTPEQQRKKEEKLRSKELKKRQNKFKVVI